MGPAGSGRGGEARTAPATITSAAARAAPQVPTAAAARLETETDWKPQVEFKQSFVIAHPIEEVWAFFSQVEGVAACLPGASLDGGEKDGRVNGKIRVKAGPISAEFSGVAHITRNDETRRGTIVGSGRDARSDSATRGMIVYSVKSDEGGSGSRIDVDVGYTLTGMLAQFSRSGLVQDVASRLTAAFARNLEARLSAAGDVATPPVVRELNAGSLMWTVLLDRVKSAFGKVFGRP
jgi:aerobic carbon-monoxide dehydrogenase small subunit